MSTTTHWEKSETPLKSEKKVCDSGPKMQQESLQAGGLRVTPSHFNQRVSDDLIQWLECKCK